MDYTFLNLNLQLFGDGAAAGGAAGGDGSGVNGNAAGSDSGVNAAEGNAAADASAAEKQAQERANEFDRLIKEEYKDLYDNKVKDTITKRLKSSKAEIAKYAQLAPALDLLSRKYGTEKGDYAALTEAIKGDESFYEEMAMDKGWSVEDTKAFMQAQDERDALQAQLDEINVQRHLATLNEQAETTKNLYPAFDLEAEMQNEEFYNLVSSGVNIQTAFEVLHKDEIMPVIMQKTAATVKQKMAKDIQARGLAAAESGLDSQSAIQTHTKVANMTKAERDALATRAMRGEYIPL